VPIPGQENLGAEPLQARRTDYEQRVVANPEDTDALEGLARVQAASKNFSAAIAAYRRVLAIRPDDRDARIQIARLLGWNRQYEDSMRAFRAVLEEAPDDPEALEGLAHVQVWSGELAGAAVTYGRLAAQPGETQALFEAARLEAETGQYPAARARLTSLLAIEPENTDARLLLAQLELKQGQHQSSLRQFERVLERRPADLEALLGAAQTRYYIGDLGRAASEAGEVVARQPQNFDALFLLASIERARGHRSEARNLMGRAERVSSHNPEVAQFRERFWSESSTVLHLTAGYTREIGSPAPGVPASLAEEDLRTFIFGSRLDFNSLPRTSSSLAFSALPTKSPSGIIAGAAAPTDFLYSQTTRLVKQLTVRGGGGLEHFGSGALVDLPKGYGPQPGATTSPIGYIGGTYAATEHLSFDITWSHLGITYTPLATRLGVVSTRLEGRANVSFNPRTSLNATYYTDHLATEAYQHALPTDVPGAPPVPGPTRSDQESGSGGTLAFNQRALVRERLALELGASAMALGYDGPRRGVYLGFFTPSFYQRELFNTRVYGQFSKRLGYDLSTGIGVQQIDHGEPYKLALVASPALTFRLKPYLFCRVGYTYYNSAQSLGVVNGNGVQFGIDWKF
jgi:tetratricopeptide (TPR) repeat protein